MWNPITFVRRQLCFVGSGFVDRGFSRLTRKKCTFSGAVMAKLHKCEPWSDHFYRSSLDSMNQAASDKNFSAMRIMAALGAKEGGSKFCIELAEKAIELLASGEEVTFESFFMLE